MDETIKNLRELLAKLELERDIKLAMDAVSEDKKDDLVEIFEKLPLEKKFFIITYIWGLGKDLNIIPFNGNAHIYGAILRTGKCIDQKLIKTLISGNVSEDNAYPPNISLGDFEKLVKKTTSAPVTKAVIAITRGFDYFTRLQSLEIVMKTKSHEAYDYLKKKYTMTEDAIEYSKGKEHPEWIEMFDETSVILRDIVPKDVFHDVISGCRGPLEIYKVLPHDNSSYFILYKYDFSFKEDEE